MLTQPDGKIVIGGPSFSIPGVGVTRIARLTTDGNLEPAFLNPYYFADGVVIALVLQEDGKIIFACYPLRAWVRRWFYRRRP